MPDQPHSCPLCTFTDESRDDVYDHLLSSHRKRAIGSVLLDERSDRR